MRRWIIIAGLVAAAAWIGFVMFLDFRYGMFPRTTGGGLKILAVAAVIVLVAYGLVTFLRRHLRFRSH